jgi:hypothetical protein
MKHLYESILADIDDTLDKGDDDVAKVHIYNLLANEEWFEIGFLANRSYDSIKKKVILKKKGKKWFVDVEGSITCYCPEGYITDGSFEFDNISGDFKIFSKQHSGICNCKSLKYGPKSVGNNLRIMDCPELKNLKYCPEKVRDTISIGYTGIETLKYFPEYSTFVEIIGNKSLKNMDSTNNVNIKEGVRIINNGFESTMKDMENCKWKIVGKNPYFLCDI